MKPSYVKDWTTLAGTTIEIRYQGTIVNHGYVDAVTPDGTILWLHTPGQDRKLYEKAEHYEVWATSTPLTVQKHENKGKQLG